MQASLEKYSKGEFSALAPTDELKSKCRRAVIKVSLRPRLTGSKRLSFIGENVLKVRATLDYGSGPFL
jgi:hypothetical protein